MGAAESVVNTYSFKETDVDVDASLFKFVPGTHRKTGAPVSVFMRKATDNPSLNAINKLKTIRHPGIIKFLGSEIGPCVYLITEPVVRLKHVLAQAREEDICLGLNCLVKTLGFLHSLGLAHNFVHIDSVYVTVDHRWVLGNFEYLDSVHDKDVPIDASSSHFGKDLVGLGTLLKVVIEDVFDRLLHSTMTVFDWKGALVLADSLCSGQQLSPSWILAQPCFKDNIVIQIVESLNDIRAIPVEKKVQMFAELSLKLRQVPRHSVETFLLPRLLRAELMVEPGAAPFFTELFTLDKMADTSHGTEDKNLISSALFGSLVIPFIGEMFKSRQYEVRVILLASLERYMDAIVDLEPMILEDVIMNELVLGFDEVDPTIYYSSVSALIKTIYPYCRLLQRKARQRPTDPSPRNSRRGITMSGIVVQSTPEEKYDPNTISAADSHSDGRLIRDFSSASLSSYSLLGLVENLIIPHCIKVCLDDASLGDLKWNVLHDLVTLWKRLCVFLSGSKVHSSVEIGRVISSLIRSIHLILRILDPHQKILFMTHWLVGSLDHIGDPNLVIWVPKVLEILVHFLKDDNQEVRRETTVLFGRLVHVLALATDRVSSVSKKRDTNGLVARLSQLYGGISRTHHSFTLAGPRPSSRRSSTAEPPVELRESPSLSQNGSPEHSESLRYVKPETIHAKRQGQFVKKPSTASVVSSDEPTIIKIEEVLLEKSKPLKLAEMYGDDLVKSLKPTELTGWEELDDDVELSELAI